MSSVYCCDAAVDGTSMDFVYVAGYGGEMRSSHLLTIPNLSAGVIEYVSMRLSFALPVVWMDKTVSSVEPGNTCEGRPMLTDAGITVPFGSKKNTENPTPARRMKMPMIAEGNLFFVARATASFTAAGDQPFSIK